MTKTGPVSYCPRCHRLCTCFSVPLKKAKTEPVRNLYYQLHQDVRWYRRARQCSECHEVFVTAELDQSMLDELILLRKTIIQKRKRAINKVKEDYPWIELHEPVPKELAQAFLRASCWWLTHSSGMPVRAPGHADRIYSSTIHGWAVDFGANTFLVGKAIERSGRKIKEFLEAVAVGTILPIATLKNNINFAISSAVTNYEGYEYDYYPISGTELIFGAQSVDLDDACTFLLRTIKLQEMLANPFFSGLSRLT
ncbi:hypothetical protein [Geomonas anaerohicana]|uniref:Transposase n=1 Tax=Geomonas anaerohicana TaxID=2798583 RepID=A0ABS0YC68_9BACT|nr:hypothetical protein [Geomonas anaerohicana]MBJ6749893.1 hypothetical protein [Geomonas anaerohicana]